MDATAQLWLFFLIVLGVVLLPGLDMAFVLASSVVGGRRAGIAATSGIVAGGICHVAMAALGIVAVLQLLPGLFNLMLLVGSAYVAWIGFGLLGSEAALGALPSESRRSHGATFRQGMVTSLLNPKAYLFMFAIFPQFFDPARGALWLQAFVLWLIIAVTQIMVYGGMALAGDRVRVWLTTRPAANAVLARTLGGLLIATAIYSIAAGWRLL